MLTAAALLELDWRTPGMDYHTLMKLTKILCLEKPEAVEQMFRRMCFNVLAHNRDDHSKNFSFIYDDRTDRWDLSPAYDLTWSNTWYGEHTTTVNGNGKDPGENDLLAVGKAAGMAQAKCRRIIAELRQETDRLLHLIGM
jgi:serine/threonine-protein kinase HipA